MLIKTKVQIVLIIKQTSTFYIFTDTGGSNKIYSRNDFILKSYTVSSLFFPWRVIRSEPNVYRL